MKRHTLIEEGDAVVMTRKRSKSGLIVGTPMLCVGSGCLLFGMATLGTVGQDPTFGRVLVAAMLLGIGVVFAGLGAAAAFGTASLRIDRANRLVIQFSRILLFRRVIQTPLAGFDQLVIRQHRWKQKWRYTLALAGKSDLKILTTFRGRDILELAERLSSFLGLPIDDQSALRPT